MASSTSADTLAPYHRRARLSGPGRHRVVPPLLHFLGRDLFFARGEVPAMTERIHDEARAVAEELVFDRPEHGGPRVGRLLHGVIDVWHVKVQRDGRAADGQ